MKKLQQWPRVKEIVGSALERQPDERAAFLDEVCAQDSELRKEVESLLSAYQDADRLSSFPWQVESTTSETSPQTIGPYRLLKKLGVGGMGQVWLAEQTEPVQRQVALKLIKDGMYDATTVQRFKAERQSLAIMDHPAIAKVFDAGTTSAGQPYLVMEYVDGLPITDYCDFKKLSIRERLQLFLRVCEGVQHAHQKAIIHRDLKPSNILVVEVDNKPMPRIIDFGLAKGVALAPGETLFTQIGAFLGTPGYMSPEQADPNLHDVDMRTDVYSLGVVLYELLTGYLPFDTTQWEKQRLDEMLRQLRGTDPPRPSSRVSRNRPTSTSKAEARGTEAGQLVSLLRGDLDWITLKALEKERQQRYETASALAGDVERYLENRPVGARQASALYCLRTYVRRNRIALTAAFGSAVLVIAFTLLAFVFAGFFLRYQATKRLTEKDTVVLTDFINKTGDPVFDDTLRQALTVNLGQSPFINILSDRKTTQTLHLMGLRSDQPLTSEVARDLCQRVGSKTTLVGTIANLGGEYVIGLIATNCATGDQLATVQVRASRKAEVLKALDKAASQLRDKLGESLVSIQKFATPLEEATTSSLEALKAYSLGVKTHREKGDAAALPFFQHATELDPNFAMAYRSLSVVYTGLNETEEAIRCATSAYSLRSRVTERERLSIESNYYLIATGELVKADQVYELYAKTYPQDPGAHANFGYTNFSLGRYEKALFEYREALRLDPDNVRSYTNVAGDLINLSRFDESRAVLQQVQARKLGDELLWINLYSLAFARRDTEEMRHLVEDAAAKPGLEDELLNLQSDTEAYFGRFKKARELTRRAQRVAQQNGEKETAAGYLVTAALREVEIGNSTEARRDVALGLAMSTGWGVQTSAALALARAGELRRARFVAENLSKRFPLNTLIHSFWVPTIQAAIELHRKHAGGAAQFLEATTDYDLAPDTHLLSIYLRGQVFLKTGQGTNAAAQFQKILNNPGTVDNFVVGALAHLGLARAYVVANDSVKARAAYQDFLVLWKDADPDLPILKTAKIEYAKLQ